MLRRRFFWGLMLGHVALAVSSLVTVPSAAFAHEKWFVEEGQHAGERVSMGTTNALVIFVVATAVLGLLVLRHAKVPKRVLAVLDLGPRSLPKGLEWRIVAVFAGVMLVASSIAGSFLAPEQVLPGPGLVLAGRIVQMIIGILLISQLSFFLSGLLIAAVAAPLATLYFAPDFLIDYGIEYVSLAAVFAFVGLSSSCPDRLASRVCRRLRLQPQGFSHLPLPIIRVGLGLTFISLALHYKLLDPNIALTFLDKHDLNFMPYLGFTGFTNLHFVFAAGMAEITFGLLLVSGIATKLVSGSLLLFFLTTLIILGPIELVGHLPIIAVLLLLLYRKPETLRLAGSTVQRASYS